MCLAYPGKVIKIKNKKYGIVDFGGITKEINLELIKKPKIGDYVNVHAGFAIQKLSQEDALELFKIYEKKLRKTMQKDESR
jgi:hydrogenase expression/formation protein HypC